MLRVAAPLAALFLLTTITNAADRIHCTVDHCHDGDTCTLACGTRPDTYHVKVRLHCIDTPELGQRPWGQLSRDSLRGAIPPGEKVTLEPLDTDRHGRIVGVIWWRSRNVNLAMVRTGNAAVFPKYCTDSTYYAAEREARAARRGIWRSPGLQQRPWEWRHR